MKKVISMFILFALVMFCIPSDVLAEEDNTTINIAFATDNNFVYPTLVSMTSVLENKNINSKINFYILLSDSIAKEDQQTLLNTQEDYENCQVNIIDMKNSYREVSVVRHLSTAAYYRLKLPSLLPNIDKILYIDGDTIAQQDLAQLYNIDIDNYYIAGVKDLDAFAIRGNEYVNQIGIKSCEQYVNSGVLLMNLKKMREDNLEEKFDEFIAKYHNPEHRIGIFHDQDVLNAVCYNHIYILPLKYNAMEHQFKKVSEGKISDISICYTGEEWNEAYTNPAIIHFTLKSWRWIKDSQFKKIWWKCAQKTKVFNKIKRKYSYGSKCLKDN